MKLKTQYKTAGAFYATGTAIIMLSELKTKQGRYIFMPHGRENIKKVAVSKVENGTLTVADLIREINAENQAKQLKSLHEIQLIKRLYEVKNNINK